MSRLLDNLGVSVLYAGSGLQPEPKRFGSIYKIEPAARVQSGAIEPTGFTLIELIIFLVLAGVILPFIFIPFMTGLKDYEKPQIVSTATFLGEELMEEIKSKNFDDIIDGYTGSTVPLPGYSRSVTVFYVSDDTQNPNLNNPVEPGPTRFKRIEVTVIHSQIPDVVLTTLVSN